jgi:glutaredoxin 3
MSASPLKVKIYGFAYCPFYQRAISLCESKNIAYTTVVFEDRNDPLYIQMRARANNFPTTPLIFVNGTFCGGLEELKTFLSGVRTTSGFWSF